MYVSASLLLLFLLLLYLVFPFQFMSSIEFPRIAAQQMNRSTMQLWRRMGKRGLFSSAIRSDLTTHPPPLLAVSIHSRTHNMHAMTWAWDVCRLQPGFNKEVLQWRVGELEDDIATVEFVSESRGSGQIKTRPLSSSTLYNLPDKHESREITTRVNTNDWPRRMTTGQADMN